jgi:hypothetical protein
MLLTCGSSLTPVFLRTTRALGLRSHLASAGHPRRDIAVRTLYRAVSGFALVGCWLAGFVYCRFARRSDYFEYGSWSEVISSHLWKRSRPKKRSSDRDRYQRIMAGS